MSPSSQQTVIVGMSGGVDSSVTALRLVEAGCDVQGLFMFNWAEDEDGYCDAARDFEDAGAVCRVLGIPLLRVDFSKEYRERVFDYFLAEYAAGRTPNPDVLCNREIKFKAFLEYALGLGADQVATGHYARLVAGDHGPELHRAADSNKDQTYFLSAVPGENFADVCFPLATLRKPEVRKMAQAAGLPIHAKKDSTGICFIGERNFPEFLSRYLPAQPGEIETDDGQVIGRHGGLMYYTLGQRRGLGIGGVRGAGDAPWYVVDKQLDRNVLVVAQQHDHPLLMSHALSTGPVNWIGLPPDIPFRCTAAVRYGQAGAACEIRAAEDGNLVVAFDSPQWAATPGQYVVFYVDDRCLGGAAITAVSNQATARAGTAS